MRFNLIQALMSNPQFKLIEKQKHKLKWPPICRPPHPLSLSQSPFNLKDQMLPPRAVVPHLVPYPVVLLFLTFPVSFVIISFPLFDPPLQ